MGEARVSRFELQPEGIDWQEVEWGDYESLPAVLYFEDNLPEELERSGLYLSYEDFVNVSRDMRCGPEALTNLFHTLVLFFTHDPELYLQALSLRYNQANHSYWNSSSPTRNFYLLADRLAPYASAKVKPEFKIPGVGNKGRRIIRAVIYDETQLEQLES